MNTFDGGYFIHAAYIFLLMAYSVRDILSLPLFALASALISVPYFVMQPILPWEALG